MILILSDDGILASDIKKQLDYYRDSYIVYFTDFKTAGSFGSGNVIIGDSSSSSVSSAILSNDIKAVIDAVAEPLSPLSDSAKRVCAKLGVDYVKYLNLQEKPGLELYLYYSDIADMIVRLKGNALFYASPRTVSGVASAGGKACADKMYAPIPKSSVFDTATALEYAIPLLNVIEEEWLSGEEAVSSVLEKTSSKMIVCDDTAFLDDKAAVAFSLGIPLILTHSKGTDFSKAAATARDAVISIHKKN